MPGLSIVRLHGSFHFRFWYNPRLSIVWFHDSFHFRFSVRQRVLIRFIFVNQKLFDVGRTCLAARNLFGCEKLFWVRETIFDSSVLFCQLGSFLPARFRFITQPAESSRLALWLTLVVLARENPMTSMLIIRKISIHQCLLLEKFLLSKNSKRQKL